MQVHALDLTVRRPVSQAPALPVNNGNQQYHKAGCRTGMARIR
jgi:hypothetical protein